MNMAKWRTGSSATRTSRSGGDHAHQIPGKMRMMVASQKLGVASPKMAKERPT